MAQNISLMNSSYSNVPAVTLPKTGGGTATFTDVTDTTATASDVSSSKYFYTAQGVRTQGTNSGGGGSSKNIQCVMDKKSVRTNGYTSTGMSITVAKAGTYNVSWVGWRSSSQGTMGSNLYKNGNAGTAQQTFTNTYGQQITLSNQSYNQGDVLTLYATAGSTSRYMWVANLIIEEV